MTLGNVSWELGGVGKVGLNLNWGVFVAVILLVAVIGMPHDDTMVSGFLILHRPEARFKIITKILYIIVHYYGVGKENLSIITTINVWANIGYVHINYDF